MRVRALFWVVLAAVCIGAITLAAVVSLRRALPMRARVDQVSAAQASTLLRLLLTDPEGTPIEQAAVIPSVSMPAMSMQAQRASVQELGQGVYLARISFSMAGLWQVELLARADGFAPARQLLQLAIT